MKITATPTDSIDNSVHIEFTDETGTCLLFGGRYYSKTDWNADPQAIIAAFSAEYDKRNPAITGKPAGLPPVTMDATALAAKLDLIAKAEAAKAVVSEAVPLKG